MSTRDSKGSFSLGLRSLELQVKHLLEGCGGEKAERLLNLLSELDPKHTSDLLDSFISAAETARASEPTRAAVNDDMTEFENGLFQALSSSLDVVPLKDSVRKLEVVSGGKSRQQNRSQLIDLSAARRSRRSSIN